MLCTVYFNVVDAADGAVATQVALLCLPKLIYWVIVVISPFLHRTYPACHLGLKAAFRRVVGDFGNAFRVLGEGVVAAVRQSHGCWVRADRLILRQSLVHFP